MSQTDESPGRARVSSPHLRTARGDSLHSPVWQNETLWRVWCREIRHPQSWTIRAENTGRPTINNIMSVHNDTRRRIEKHNARLEYCYHRLDLICSVLLSRHLPVVVVVVVVGSDDTRARKQHEPPSERDRTTGGRESITCSTGARIDGNARTAAIIVNIIIMLRRWEKKKKLTDFSQTARLTTDADARDFPYRRVKIICKNEHQRTKWNTTATRRNEWNARAHGTTLKRSLCNKHALDAHWTRARTHTRSRSKPHTHTTSALPTAQPVDPAVADNKI